MRSFRFLPRVYYLLQQTRAADDKVFKIYFKNCSFRTICSL